MEKPAASRSTPPGARQPLDRDIQRCLKGGPGLGGFDPVSYRTNLPELGSSEFAHSHRGVTYHFASEANRDHFAADPSPYLPRYGGWCAMSLALGSFSCPDYSNFKLEDGQLFLFETTVFTNGRILWDRDPAGNRARADGHWFE